MRSKCQNRKLAPRRGEKGEFRRSPLVTLEGNPTESMGIVLNRAESWQFVSKPMRGRSGVGCFRPRTGKKDESEVLELQGPQKSTKVEATWVRSLEFRVQSHPSTGSESRLIKANQGKSKLKNDAATPDHVPTRVTAPGRETTSVQNVTFPTLSTWHSVAKRA